MRKRHLLVNSCVLWLVGVGVPAVLAQESVARPNVVIVLADDLGYADLGFQGASDIPTPHLDRLAAAGVRCTSGYSSHPFCSPMRAAMMTGRYQQRFGYERNIAYDPHNNHMGLPAGETTVAERLRRAGYATAMIGKWHLGAARPFHPNMRGYDYFFGFLGGGHDYFEVDLIRPMGEGYRVPLQENGTPVRLEDYLTTVLTERAVDFIHRAGDQPFFLFLSYNAPHTPLQAPADRLADFDLLSNDKRKRYAAMVSVLDDGVGAVVGALLDAGIEERTLVFFLSDNGGPESSNGSRNDPLRGQKGDLYEGGIRVPFVACWPGVLPPSSRYDHPVHSIDVSCTALALAGIPLEGPFDGVNLLPYLDGTESSVPHPALFWRKEGGAAWAVRSGNWKLIQLPDRPPQLYELGDDIAESHNVADDHTEQVARLQGFYETWNADNRPPFFPSFRDYHRVMDAHYREISGPVEPGDR